MSQCFDENIKRPKLQVTQLGIFEIYAFCQKIQQCLRTSREPRWGHISVYEGAPEKLPIPLKVATTLLNSSRKSAGGV